MAQLELEYEQLVLCDIDQIEPGCEAIDCEYGQVLMKPDILEYSF
jgi:hypothetical protein